MESIDFEKISIKLREYVKNNNIRELRSFCKEYSEIDIADALTKLEDLDVLKVIRSLNSETSAEIFRNLNNEYKKYVIETFSNIEILDILQEFFTDDIVELLDEMPANITKKILKSVNKEIRQDINKILKYDDSTSGSIMSVEFIEIRDNKNLKEALEIVKKNYEESKETNNFYVINDKRKLLGYVTLKDIIFNSDEKNISEIMKKNVIFVHTFSDQEEAVELFKKYELTDLPVVNKQNKLVGIITFDDIVDVIEEEATEDIEKQAGILPSERSYFDISPFKMVKLRVFWLLFLMVSATLSQLAISAFMNIYKISDTTYDGVNEITYIVTGLLVPVIPLISGTSGNAGSQTSIMVVRGLSIGSIKIKDWYQIIIKELQVGLIIGIILVIINFLRMYIIDVIELGTWELDKNHWYVIIILSLSLLITILLSKTIGGILPIIAKLFKIDPAVIAAPLLTTLVDALSTTIFFSISLIFFSELIT